MIPIEDVLAAHAQKYVASCSPSLIEMILKIYEAVPLDYFDLQHANPHLEGLEKYNGKVLHGVSFQKHDPATGQSFLDRLRMELEQGHIVGLYCYNKDQPDPLKKDVHGWILYDLTPDHIHLVSKPSELGAGEGRQTICVSFPLIGENSVQITDLVFGTLQNENGTDEDT